MKLLPAVLNAHLCLVAVLAAPAARAADPTQVANARAFLTDPNRAKGTLFFAHPTGTYQSTEVFAVTDVVDGLKQPIPGAFAVHVRYSWKSLFDDANSSDLVFLFNARGRLTEIQLGRTTSIFQQFSGADLVLAAVKDELLKEVKKWDDADARRLAITLIDAADTKGILTLVLQRSQP